MSGYRLPAGLRLGPVRLRIGELSRSLAFYQSVLGLTLLQRDGIRARLGAGTTALLELDPDPGTVPSPGRGRLGLFHFAILLPDRVSLGRLIAHLTARSIPFGAADHLVSEAIYLSDPDGLGIEVYADRPQSSWHTRDGELEMATLPLDRAALVEAAGATRWDGMPDGTVLGHMHLHVGSLPEAGRFYETGLGFSATVRSYPGALFLAAGGYHHHLGLNTWAGPGAIPPADNEARLLDWELVLPYAEDLDAAAASLGAAGFEPALSPGGWQIRDPWGTMLKAAAAG